MTDAASKAADRIEDHTVLLLIDVFENIIESAPLPIPPHILLSALTSMTLSGMLASLASAYEEPERRERMRQQILRIADKLVTLANAPVGKEREVGLYVADVELPRSS